MGNIKYSELLPNFHNFSELDKTAKISGQVFCLKFEAIPPRLKASGLGLCQVYTNEYNRKPANYKAWRFLNVMFVSLYMLDTRCLLEALALSV